MGSLAADTRKAVDETPFLRQALQTGVVNFAAAARYLDVDGDEEAIATALRRYAEELPDVRSGGREVRVQMQSGVDPDIVTVGETSAGEVESADLTAIIASGAVDSRFLGDVLVRLANLEVPVHGAGVTGETAVVLVPRRHGATALRLVEQAAEA